MKKNVFILSALCFAAMTLVFSGCKKENNDPQEPAKVQTYQMSIQASKGADNQANGPRRVISLGGGGTLNAAWENGDQVTVRNVTKSADLDGQLTAESGGVNTQLNGTLTGAVSVGDELLLKYQTPNNYADQDGTLEYISANCDYATATVAVATVEGGAITANADAVFENQQAIVKFTLKNEDGSATIDAKPLVIEVAGETYTITPASATSEMYVALPGFASQNITFTATVGSDTYKKEVASVSLTNGEFYEITVRMTKQTAPAVNGYGPFSVSDTKQVYFSKGNLQATYNGSEWSWDFAANQWTTVGNSAANTSISGNGTVSENGTVDLFGWSTNATYYGIHNEIDYRVYSGDFKDWGTLMGDGWRTLSKDEWYYLFVSRNGGTTSNANANEWWGLATVNGVEGLVILPDNPPTSLTSSFTSAKAAGRTTWSINSNSNGDFESWDGASETYNYSSNIYSGDAWTAMETAGAVFLPATGFRAGEGVEVRDEGHYWSSSAGETDARAYSMYIWKEFIIPKLPYDDRMRGCFVRLAKDAN